MNYIVLDLEWNQGNEEKEKQRKDIPFEIIEIGAIKLDGRMEFGGSFHEVVKPQVYQEMHRMTRQLLHMDMEQLQEEISFRAFAGDFFPGAVRRRRGCRRGTGAERSGGNDVRAVSVRHLGAAGSDGAAEEHAVLRNGASRQRTGEVL